MTNSQPSAGNKSFVDHLLAVLGPLLPARFRADRPVVPVIRLGGVIGAAAPLRPGLSLAAVAPTLDKAFAVRGARAVALLINSPGGAPVQSHLIFQRIRQLADEKKIPVFAFIEDVGASGGYMLACAGDEIVADRFSIVGSIGVVGASFGFVKLIDKIGVERRLYTSGDRKVTLDPFLPEKPEDIERLKTIQKDIHEHFKDLVRTRRATRLKGDEAVMFSGEFWTANAARDLGLIDAIGDFRTVLRERYGEKVRLPLIEAKRGLLAGRIPGLAAGRVSVETAGLSDDIIAALDARAMWSRYGM